MNLKGAGDMEIMLEEGESKNDVWIVYIYKIIKNENQ